MWVNFFKGNTSGWFLSLLHHLLPYFYNKGKMENILKWLEKNANNARSFMM